MTNEKNIKKINNLLKMIKEKIIKMSLKHQKTRSSQLVTLKKHEISKNFDRK